MYRITSLIIIFKSIIISSFFKYSLARPDLILGSFIGVGGVRIQTYTLEAPNPKGRAILVHGSRSHFAADFLISEYNFQKLEEDPKLNKKKCPLRKLGKLFKCCKKKSKKDKESKASTSKNDDIKWKVIGDLKLEKTTINLYEDGTNGWDIQDTYKYEDTTCSVANSFDITVHGLDMRSFGRSESPKIPISGRVRGLVDSYDYMARDLITYIEMIKNKYQDGLPVYLIGFSMGGTVSIRALELYDGKLVDGMALIFPALRILSWFWYHAINKGWKFHQVMTKALPNMVVAPSNSSIDDSPVGRIKIADPLCVVKGVQYKTGFQMVKLLYKTHRDVADISPDIPILFFHSLRDDICYFDGVERLYNNIPHVKKRRFVILDQFEHFKVSAEFYLEIATYLTEWLITGDSNYKFKFDYSIRDN